MVLPGLYVFETGYDISEDFSGVYDVYGPESGITTGRTINIVSQQGAGATSITCVTGNAINVLVIQSGQYLTTTLTMTIDGFTFFNCSLAVSFIGQSLVVQNSVFENNTSAVEAYFAYHTVVRSSHFYNNPGETYVQGVYDFLVQDCTFVHTMYFCKHHHLAIFVWLFHLGCLAFTASLAHTPTHLHSHTQPTPLRQSLSTPPMIPLPWTSPPELSTATSPGAAMVSCFQMAALLRSPGAPPLVRGYPPLFSLLSSSGDLTSSSAQT